MTTRRDLREEAEHLPATIDDLLELRDRVMLLGESRVRAEGLCMWVLAKQRGEADTTSPNTRSEYRKILRRLEPAGPANGGRRRRARKDDGLTELKLAAAGATGAASALAVASATGNPVLTVLALLAPVIPADESYVESVGFERLAA